MKFSTFATITIAITLAAAPRPALAQLGTPVSVELQDAPVRSTIEAIFKQAGIKNYVIDNAVAGLVTLKITEQPLESALKLVMRANSLPLTYTVENDVWIVKPRTITVAPSLPTPVPELPTEAPRPRYERINLTYLDPADLQGILGNITMVRQFTRYTGGQGVSSGNGLMGRPGQQGGTALMGNNSPMGMASQAPQQGNMAQGNGQYRR